MPNTSVPARKIPPALNVAALVVLIALAAGGLLLHRSSHTQAAEGPSPEANAYLSNLRLSDVTMKAAENLMHQQVVYVDGHIRNAGSRPIQQIDVYCLFYGVDGREIYRERASIVHSGGQPFTPSQTRAFELAFDNLPEGWNQAMPRLIIAQIRFAE